MNELRLLIYIIILIVSIVNIVSFYSGKRRQKKISGSVMEALVPVRKISTREATALNRLNKRNLAAGAPVYRIEGSYESNTLTVNNSQTEKIVTIGGVVVEFQDQLEGYLQDQNHAEIVDTDHKKGAVILNLNDKFSAVDEADIRKAMEEGKTYQKRSAVALSPGAEDKPSEAGDRAEDKDVHAFEFHQGRELQDDEFAWLAPDYRIGACIFTALLLFLAVVIPVLPVKGLLAAAGTILFLISLLPLKRRNVPGKFRKKTLVLSGNLAKGSDGWLMDRFSLDFPEQWETYLTEGKKCSLEGYPMDPLGTNLKVLSLNGLYSIQRELKRTPFRRKDRWLLFSLLGGLVLILSLLPVGKIPFKGVQIFNYYMTRGMRKEFRGYDDINTASLIKGQEVSFSGFHALPSLRGEDNGYYLIPDDSYGTPEFSAVREALNMIEGMQQTDEMLQLTALELRDEMAPSEFLYKYYPDEEPAKLAEFASYYRENRDFHILKEIFETLRAVPEGQSVAMEDRISFPEGGYLKDYYQSKYSEQYWTFDTLLGDIGSVKGNLLWDEGLRINDLLLEEYREYLDTHGAVRIDTYAPPEYYSFVNSDELYRFKRSSTWRGDKRLPMEFNDPITAFQMLSDLEETLAGALGSPRETEGIITNIQMRDSRITRITLDEYLDYGDVYLYHGDCFIFLVLLILTGYAVASMLRIMKLSSRRALRPHP